MWDGAAVLLCASNGRGPRFARRDGSGWLVLKGIIFDVKSPDPHVDLDKLLERFIETGRIEWDRYEGTFALCAWDARRRSGLVANDQTSLMNLYVCEEGDGLYVTTTALPLARALGRGLSPDAVKEFLTRGALIAPTAMFDGFRRLDVGEHVTFTDGEPHTRVHWKAIREPNPYRSVNEAGADAADVSVDRIGRYAAVAGTLICDLTSGYDSRMLASAADRAGISPTVTVNGPTYDEDVSIALRVAKAVPWPMEHFDTRTFWTEPVDPGMRRTLTFHTNGELPFTRIYHHLHSRPQLAARFGCHHSQPVGRPRTRPVTGRCHPR